MGQGTVMAETVNPVILSLHLCERVVVDRATNQASLLQLIENVNTPKFPVRVPRWFLYSEFTGCHGTVNLSFRIVDVGEELDPVCQISIQIQQDDPVVVAHVVAQLPVMVFPREGAYLVQAVPGDGTPFEKRLTVRNVSSSPPGAE